MCILRQLGDYKLCFDYGKYYIKNKDKTIHIDKWTKEELLEVNDNNFILEIMDNYLEY